jgi:hypothetical protein
VGNPVSSKGFYRSMDTQMIERTLQEVLARKRERYAWAGKAHKARLLDELAIQAVAQLMSDSVALGVAAGSPVAVGRHGPGERRWWNRRSSVSRWRRCGSDEYI